MKKIKITFIPMLLFILLLTLSVPVNAASKKTVITESIEMKTNETVNMDLKLKSKAVWTVSNPKVVTVTAEGKYNQTAAFSTGNKTGTCVVKATVKNKVYKYKVTVKKGTIIKAYKGSVSKAVFDKMTKNYTVTVKFCNASEKDKWYGYPFSLQRYEDGKWKTVPMNDDYMFDAIALSVPAKTSVTHTYPLASYYDGKELRKGTYRIYTNYTVASKNRYVKFKIS